MLGLHPFVKVLYGIESFILHQDQLWNHSLEARLVATQYNLKKYEHSNVNVDALHLKNWLNPKVWTANSNHGQCLLIRKLDLQLNGILAIPTTLMTQQTMTCSAEDLLGVFSYLVEVPAQCISQVTLVLKDKAYQSVQLGQPELFAGGAAVLEGHSGPIEHIATFSQANISISIPEEESNWWSVTGYVFKPLHIVQLLVCNGPTCPITSQKSDTSTCVRFSDKKGMQYYFFWHVILHMPVSCLSKHQECLTDNSKNGPVC